MRLFFVRHGQTIWNVLGRVQGSSDIELTETGISQAKDFSASCSLFVETTFDAVYSSDLKRAQQTAEILCASKQTSLSVILCPALRERYLSDFEGKPLKEMIAALSDWEQLPEEEKWTTSVAQSETFESVLKRVCLLIEQLKLKHNEDETILMVTHSDVLRALYLSLTKTPSLAKMVGFHNLGYVVVESTADGLVLVGAHGQVILD